MASNGENPFLTEEERLQERLRAVHITQEDRQEGYDRDLLYAQPRGGGSNLLPLRNLARPLPPLLASQRQRLSTTPLPPLPEFARSSSSLESLSRSPPVSSRQSHSSSPPFDVPAILQPGWREYPSRESMALKDDGVLLSEKQAAGGRSKEEGRKRRTRKAILGIVLLLAINIGLAVGISLARRKKADAAMAETEASKTSIGGGKGGLAPASSQEPATSFSRFILVQTSVDEDGKTVFKTSTTLMRILIPPTTMAVSYSAAGRTDKPSGIGDGTLNVVVSATDGLNGSGDGSNTRSVDNQDESSSTPASSSPQSVANPIDNQTTREATPGPTADPDPDTTRQATAPAYTPIVEATTTRAYTPPAEATTTRVVVVPASTTTQQSVSTTTAPSNDAGRGGNDGGDDGGDSSGGGGLIGGIGSGLGLGWGSNGGLDWTGLTGANDGHGGWGGNRHRARGLGAWS